MDESNRITHRDEQVSALVDGCLPRGEWDACLQRLECEDEAQAQWHVYHLIGDVLRSEDLACHDGGHDRFMARLRVRLSSEDAIQSIAVHAASTRARDEVDLKTPAANDGLFRWKMVAGLASVASVAAVGWSLATGLGDGGRAQLAAQDAAPAVLSARVQRAPGDARALMAPQAMPGAENVRATALVEATTTSQAAVPAAVMLRDPRLDELLAAHRQLAAGAALDGAGGLMRTAALERPAR